MIYLKQCVSAVFYIACLSSQAQGEMKSWIKEDSRGNAFEIVDSGAIDWETARTIAFQRFYKGAPGHLATINDIEQQKFLQAFIKEVFDEILWLGGFQNSKSNEPDGGWIWVNNEGIVPTGMANGEYANWAAFEPDDFRGQEDFMAINLNFDGKWSDEGSLPVYGFVVEYNGIESNTTTEEGNGNDNPTGGVVPGQDPSQNNSSPDPTGAVLYTTISASKPYQFDPIDTEDLYAVNQFYHTVYKHSNSIPHEWDGNITQGDAGDTSLEFKKAVIRRVNYFRAMAGVPAKVDLDLNYSTKAQQAALIMSANDNLSHFPDQTWRHYSAAGAKAASSSNLSLGRAGSAAVYGQVDDSGSNNYSVGHRRWILYPNTQFMGTGDVFPQDKRSANALWVLDDNELGKRPQTRNAFVAWPSDGYMPYQLVPKSNRWSFSLPKELNSDMANAAILMHKNGTRLVIKKEPYEGGRGDDTIVWLPSGLEGYQPSGNDLYDIQVSVVVGGQTRRYNYQVKVFDPESKATDIDEPKLRKHRSMEQRVVIEHEPSVPKAAYAWNVSDYGELTDFITMEFDRPATFDVSGNYSSLELIQGKPTVHLAHVNYETQSLTFDNTFLPEKNAFLEFSYFIGLATPNQTVRVHIISNGMDYIVWEQSGMFSGTVSSSQMSAFQLKPVRVPLADFEGGTIQIKVSWNVNGVYYGGSSLSPFYQGVFFRSFNLRRARLLQEQRQFVTRGNFFDLEPSPKQSYISAAPVLFGGFVGAFTKPFNPNANSWIPESILKISFVGVFPDQLLLIQWDSSVLPNGGSLQMSDDVSDPKSWRPASDFQVKTDASGFSSQFRPLDSPQRFFRLSQ